VIVCVWYGRGGGRHYLRPWHCAQSELVLIVILLLVISAPGDRSAVWSMQGGDTPKAAAASKKGRGRRKKAVEGADEAPAADSTDVSPAAALGELPKPTRPRRGRPSTKNPSPGPAGGPVVGAAAATPSADAGGSEGEAGEGEAGERPPQEVEAQGTSSDEEADLAAFEEWLEDVDWGMIGDLAPCVTLRLTDTSETREIWPHKFELLYKVCAAPAAPAASGGALLACKAACHPLLHAHPCKPRHSHSCAPAPALACVECHPCLQVIGLCGCGDAAEGYCRQHADCVMCQLLRVLGVLQQLHGLPANGGCSSRPTLPKYA
jgi:hypothetical protein